MEKLSLNEKFISLSCKTEVSKRTYRDNIRSFCEAFNTNLEDIVNEWYQVKYDLVKREQFLDKWNSNLDDYKVYLRNKGYANLSINLLLAIAVNKGTYKIVKVETETPTTRRTRS